MIDDNLKEEDELKEERAAADTRTTIGKANGTSFQNFLFQPAIHQALARYVHSEAREMLCYGMSERYGKRGLMDFKEGPAWLDAATADDWKEGEEAYYALEVAIQEEVERRVAAALADARVETKKTTGPRLRELTRHLASVVRRGAVEQQAICTAETNAAMENAGLKSRTRRKKPAAKV